MNGILKIVSPRRMGRLFLRELAVSYRGLLVAGLTVAGAIIVLSAITSLLSNGQVQGDAYSGFFRLLLYVGGFIITSFAFREVWQAGSGISYLSLPGSTLEKFIVKLLLTSVGFAAGTLLFMSAVGALSEAIDRLAFNAGRGFFDPFTPAIWQTVVRYLVLQAFFLLGSIWFKKLAFVKTVLWMLVFAVALFILGAIALRIAVGPHLAALANGGGFGASGGFGGPGRPGGPLGGWMLQLNGPGFQDLFRPGSRGGVGLDAFKIAAEALFIALAPASWVAAYFRLSEAEV